MEYEVLTSTNSTGDNFFCKQCRRGCNVLYRPKTRVGKDYPTYCDKCATEEIKNNIN